MHPDLFLTHSLQDRRIARILTEALVAVEPGRIVHEYLRDNRLSEHERLYILGLGKAAEPMVRASADAFPDFATALAITKRAGDATTDRLQVMEAGHPVPDARSVLAGRAALDLAAGLRDKDLLLCLISGGGSALATSPRRGIGLREIQVLTAALLGAGASIEEINTVRRHLDEFKGGGLARATRARVLSLLLSDVVGDRIEAIASGPTAPDPTSASDAMEILDRYDIAVPPNVHKALADERGPFGAKEPRVANVVIGNNRLAAEAAMKQAQKEGFAAEILQADVQGEASAVGQKLGQQLRAAQENRPRPFCLILGGETTVTLHGNGKGGRNQELALAATDALAGLQDVMLISLATDGDDGPTDAAGAVTTGETAERARAVGMRASDYLARNNSYAYFAALDDLLKPGYTGTNVNDLMLLIAA